MNSIEEVFFILLRSALWNSAARLPRTLTQEEWNTIFAISREQTVSGIMIDAVATLPDEQKPDIKLRMQWIMQQKMIEKQNAEMNKVLIEVINLLEQEGVRAFLLKGQGVALLYPAPAHRICGDIDLYIPEEQFGKAMELFKALGCEIEDNSAESHAELTYKGFKIELHLKSALFYTKKLQKRYNSIADTILGNTQECVTIDGKKIELLPSTLNSLQLLSHMLRHILTSGIGLRQICDWVLFAHKHHKHVDNEQFIKYIQDTQLIGTYKAVTAIATDYLGLPQEYALCNITAKDKRLAKKVFNLIMTYGNFGHYCEDNIIGTKMEYLRSYVWKVKNCIRFRHLSGSEAWNYPLWQLHSAKNVIKR